ncbi:ClpP/crotonase-like domain-containing protein [Aspergillus desertorum]
MIANTDIVIASEKAFFGFPEVRRGVVAGPERCRGLVEVMEAERWGFVNEVVDAVKVVARAIEVAMQITENSPDAVIVSRQGVKMGWEGVGAEGTRLLLENWEKKLNAGENIKEGLRAFVEKRKPEWKDSKL